VTLSAAATQAYVACAQNAGADSNLQAFPGNAIATHCMKEYIAVFAALFGTNPCSSAGSSLLSAGHWALLAGSMLLLLSAMLSSLL
jgi:hypothetical protein